MRKYHNIICEYRGRRFDSIKERDRYILLSALVAQGEISDLKCQTPFILIKKNGSHREVRYVADFTYIKGGQLVVEDVKGVITPVFRLKARLFYEIFGTDIVIVK